MSGRMLVRFSPIALALVLAACGGGDSSATGPETTSTTETTETAPPPGTTALRVYFLLNDKVQPVARDVTKTEAVAGAALSELLAGPTKTERELGLESAVPGGLQVESLAIEDGLALLQVSERLPEAALAQVVYTLTQFSSVRLGVEVGTPGSTRAVGRSEFEEYTPAILVESPLPFQDVGNPLRARGTANTFEATFEYEVVEPEGRIVESHFVTATSGSGQRGTFDFTSKPYEISREGLGALIVFERSAKDGSRIHLVEIPVQMKR